MVVGLVASEPVRGNLFQVSFLDPGGFLAIFGVSWFVDTLPDLRLHVHMTFSLCAYLSLYPNPPLYQDTSRFGLEAHATSP